MPGTSNSLADRRREIQRTPALRALADRLERLAQPLLGDEVLIPSQKALLSRDGGVCEIDGSRLSFDPLSSERHICPRCDRIHEGERHYRAWVWRYHIWLSERAIHLALLGAINSDANLQQRARSILERYAAQYRRYPNSDNVLGPTRPFFSTYLESIWLTQLVIAALLLRSNSTVQSPTGFDEMVKESASLISSFDEGWSNRQVWNNTALIASGLWFGGGAFPANSDNQHVGQLSVNKLLVHGMDGPHGIRAQLVTAVTGEGMWYEGENYHFFALRGFLLAAELLRGAGLDLYGADGPHDRLRDMFVAPLRTVLPNLTLPARGDSPFGVSLLQPRFAELWEVGWSRTADPRLESLLAGLYSANAPAGDDPGLEEIAEQEQNRPASRLHRGLLGWKSLLLMNPDEPSDSHGQWQAGTALLPHAGLAVFRPGADRYVSIECGGQAGGHGHPDLLHLTLYSGQPLLMDFGTASYVTPSLHWYRSTLAHNAPGVSGAGQRSRNGWCAAFDQRGAWGWCRAVAENVLGDGTSASRTIVVGPNVVLDILDVDAPDSVLVDLPVHLLDPDWISVSDWDRLSGRRSVTENTLGEVLELEPSANTILEGMAQTTILLGREGERLLVAERPGPPDDQFADGQPMAFLVRRSRGAGRWVQCYGTSSDRPTGVRTERHSIFVDYGDGTVEKVTIKDDRCRVADRARVTHKLGKPRVRPERKPPAKSRPTVIHCPKLEKLPTPADWESAVPKKAVQKLGAGHYRRSELPFGARKPFHARVSVFVVGTELCFATSIVKSDVTFRSATDPDPAFDNETPDIHSDGLQCYVGGVGGERWSGYLLVPDPDSDAVRVSAVAGTAGDASAVNAFWTRTPEGYNMVVAVDLGVQPEFGQSVPVNFVVNEMYSKRKRRAGQLAMSGGGWVYLRGDREHAASALLGEVSWT